MREIEFRGKVINEIILNGRVVKEKDTWVYGGFTDNIGGTFILQPDSGYGFIQIKINPETIGQYTGLKDKNGTKIFEGDIVKCTRKNIDDKYKNYFGIVQYGAFNCTCCTGVYGYEIQGLDFYSLPDIRHYEEIEIVGNKYDNPELLEKGE